LAVIGELLQRPVDGGQTHTVTGLAHQGLQLLGTDEGIDLVEGRRYSHPMSGLATLGRHPLLLHLVVI
jgi:hypothetical protein